MQEAGARLAAQNLERQVEHKNLYESPAFRVSHEGLEELLAEVKRVDALIMAKPPGHPVSPLLLALKHLHKVETRFYCFQMFLSLGLQSRMTLLNYNRRLGIEKTLIAGD